MDLVVQIMEILLDNFLKIYLFLLLHGTEIIVHALLPIGQMSEDAQESCNKYIKRYYEDFTRKCSRTKTMEDLFLRSLVASDPFISSLRKLPKKKLKSLSTEAIDFANYLHAC